MRFGDDDSDQAQEGEVDSKEVVWQDTVLLHVYIANKGYRNLSLCGK